MREWGDETVKKAVGVFYDLLRSMTEHDFWVLLLNIEIEDRGLDLIEKFFFSAFDAFAGGYVAFAFRKRESTHSKLKQRFEDLSSASTHCAIVCVALLSTKRQFVKPITDKFFAEQSRVLNRLESTNAPEAPIEVVFDLFVVGPIKVDIEGVFASVQKVAFLDPRNMPQAFALRSQFDNIEYALERRNDWIEKFRDRFSSDHPRNVHEYFGIDDGSGNVDTYYSSLLRDLRYSTDSAIFFSYELYIRLSSELLDLAFDLRRRFGETYQFSHTDFSAYFDENLFPERKDFGDWLTVGSLGERPWYVSRRRWQKMLRGKIADKRWGFVDDSEISSGSYLIRNVKSLIAKIELLLLLRKL